MTRTCGSCQKCCDLIPVKEIDKPANQRCIHQSHARGCKVYRGAGFPVACRYWTCRWLSDPQARALSRPDRSGYVVDVMPDFITVRDDDTGEVTKVQVVQIWCDPKRPNAHRDPQLRAYLHRRALENIAALVRYSSHDAFVLFAPPMCSDGQWHEVHTNLNAVEHSVEEIVEALGPAYEAVDLSKTVGP